jgi:hypothetical protein
MSAAIFANLVVPFGLFVLYLLFARALMGALNNRNLALGFALAIPMALPYVVSGIIRMPIVSGFWVSFVLIAIWAIFSYFKSCQCSSVMREAFFKWRELSCVLGIILITAIIFLPGVFSDGYFVPNANFDFIYQSVDARYMYLHQPTEFNPGATGAEDLPLTWSANEQGRYLSSVIQAIVSNYVFYGDYLAGSVSAFVFFYLVFILALYSVIVAAGVAGPIALVLTVVVAGLPYNWVSVRYMLIGQLSALPIFLFLIASLVNKSIEDPPRKSVFLLCGLLCLVYFALGFFACSFVGMFLLLLLINGRLNIRAFTINIGLLVAVPALIYFAPYASRPAVAWDVVHHWLEVIFTKMYSSRSVDEVSVDFLSEFVALRILGFDFSPYLSYFSHLNSAIYLTSLLSSLLALLYITYKVIKLDSVYIAIKAVWITYLTFCSVFYFTQGGYLLFKTTAYMAIAPILVYISLYKEAADKLKTFVAPTAIIVLLGFTMQAVFHANSFMADRLGSRLTTSVGGSRDFVQLAKYLRETGENKKIWLNLSNPNAQAFVLLAAGNFRDKGIRNNYQLLENARWSDDACDLPVVMPEDLVLLESRHSAVSDARSRDVYFKPEFENSSYAIVKMKNIERLTAYSRGFYGPEPVNFSWNNTFNIGRWSTGRSAIVVYGAKESEYGLRILAFNGLDLKVRYGSSMREYKLEASSAFQNIDTQTISKGWSCIELDGDASSLPSNFNRYVFSTKKLDPRPIKYMVNYYSAD